MKIVIMIFGTRGDVQPLCVIGKELKDRGHQVRIATEEKTKYVVDQFELEYFEIPGEGVSGILQRDDVYHEMNKGNVMYPMELRKKMDKDIPERLEKLSQSVEGMDLIVSAAMTISEGYFLSEKYNIPNVLVTLQPNLKTSQFSNCMVSRKSFMFGFLNRFTYTLFDWVYCRYERDRLSNWLESSIGIEKKDINSKLYLNYLGDLAYKPNQQIICAVDKVVLPSREIPIDYQKNWHVTGFLFSQITPVISEKVRNFMSNGGSPPIVFGLGSMKSINSSAIVDMVLNVVKRLNQRLIVLSNWSNYSNFIENDKMIQVDQVDHGWLYPQCKAIIHHGGVGTTASVLKSGTPSVVTWLYVDQPYWGDRIEDLGCGISVDLKTLTEPILFNALYEITNNSLYKQKALAVSDKLKETNASKLSADIIENTFKKI